MTKKKLTGFAISIIIIFQLFISPVVYGHGSEPHSKKLNKGTITFSQHILPLIEQKCIRCHGSESPGHGEFMKDMKKYKKKMKGPKMNTYSHLVSFIIWPDTGSLMRALDDGSNTNDGKPGRMYKKLGSSEEERQKNLKTFKKWVGNWTLKDWKQISKEELDLFQLAY